MDTQETKIYIAALIASVVLAIILVYFIITIIRQQRKTQKMHREKIRAEIETLEKERARIASDLHDDLGPILSAIKFKINAVDTHSEEDKKILEKASMHTDEAIRRIRETSFDLMPNTLIRKGLTHAVEELIQKAERFIKMKILFAHSDIPELTPDMVINFYRILQEIIHNSVKHSGAKELNIELKTIPGKKILLIARDDGIGFNYEKINAENPGLGLRNIASRTEVMHGDVIIESSPGKGVKYIIEIPLNLHSV
jgi:signal transduction histidine kinase